MAQQNIQYGGMRHAPSDITGKDGDLLDCVNMINEGGELKPIEMPESAGLRLGEGEVLAFVHNPVGAKNLVVVRNMLGKAMVRVMGLDGTAVQISGENSHYIIEEKILWVNAVGNTLVVGTDKSKHYLTFKGSSYKWLGNSIPKMILEFDIEEYWVEGHNKYMNVYKPNAAGYEKVDGSVSAIAGGGLGVVLNSEDNEWNHTTYYQDDRYSEPDTGFKVSLLPEDENFTALQDSLKTFIAQAEHESAKDGYFLYPFFVRYATKLYDGTYTNISAPILMLPSTNKAPFLLYFQFQKLVGLNNYNAARMQLYMHVHPNIQIRSRALKFRSIGNTHSSDEREDWKDIINGYDIFLSSPIVTLDEEAIERLSVTKDLEIQQVTPASINDDEYNEIYGYSYNNNKKTPLNKTFYSNNEYTNYFQASDYDPAGGGHITQTEWNYTYYRFYKNHLAFLKSISEEKLATKIENTHNFYLIKHYGPNEVPMSWEYSNDNWDLTNLESNPTLSDDEGDGNFAAEVSYNYNHRLVLGNLKMKLYSINDYLHFRMFNSNVRDYVLCFCIEKDNDFYLRTTYNNRGYYDLGHYIFYPNVNCRKAIISINGVAKVVPMKEHPYLNGSYAIMPELKSFAESADVFETYTDPIPQQSSDLYYREPNTIAMSNVTNPFVFEAKNFFDVGRAEITGIAANTLDVSSGQWGSYPLHVFCKDGIVALGINDKGEFNGSQAVSADVLIEPQGISRPTVVQTGQMLVFLTSRGVMALAGSEIKPLSLVMNGRHFNTAKELQGTDLNIGSFGQLVKKASDDTAFREYAKEGFLAYDYTHNRVLLCHPHKVYQYVLSLDTMLWSKEVIYRDSHMTQIEGQAIDMANVQTSIGNTRGVLSVPVQKKFILYPIMVTGAVNDYTELYLQGDDRGIYKTMEVTEENVQSALHQYGYFVSRPVRFGTDEYKTIKRLLHRYTHYSEDSFVRLMLYGSRDGKSYGRINTLRGMSWQYFILVVYCYMKPNERYSYTSIDFETRFTNKMR